MLVWAFYMRELLVSMFVLNSWTIGILTFNDLGLRDVNVFLCACRIKRMIQMLLWLLVADTPMGTVFCGYDSLIFNSTVISCNPKLMYLLIVICTTVFVCCQVICFYCGVPNL
eukprot:gene3518-2469_t